MAEGRKRAQLWEVTDDVGARGCATMSKKHWLMPHPDIVANSVNFCGFPEHCGDFAKFKAG